MDHRQLVDHRCRHTGYVDNDRVELVRHATAGPPRLQSSSPGSHLEAAGFVGQRVSYRMIKQPADAAYPLR
jgi:hypothetical protein